MNLVWLRIDTCLVLIAIACVSILADRKFQQIERELEAIKIEIKQIYNDLIFEE